MTTIVYVRQPPQYITQPTPIDLYRSSERRLEKINNKAKKYAEKMDKLNKTKTTLGSCVNKKSNKKLRKLNKKISKYNCKLNKQNKKIKIESEKKEKLRNKAANYINIK